MYKAFVLIISLLVKIEASFEDADPLVQLPDGQILGREAITIASTSYFAFEKIPYATPPVGFYRFRYPQSPLPWDGVLNTTHLDVNCIQMGVGSPSDSEDCLYLNVFTPKLPGGDDDVALPVMLFIYGGAFTSGTSLQYPPDLFVDNGVVLVTINYRLGPFGFLSTQDEVIPGNNGLKDQRLAIQWTHRNIKLFGGDPEQITIFGESAGSASVGFQLLNQDSNGLFRGAILESGTFLNPWTYQKNSRNIAFATAALLNSTFETSDDALELLEFLKSVDAQDLNAAAEQYQSMESTPYANNIPRAIMWAPVVEVKNPDAFITKKMYGLLNAGNILQVPTLIGFNSEESLLFNQDPVAFQSVLEGLDEHLELIVPGDMQITDIDQLIEMGRSIRDIYTDGRPFADNLGDGLRYSTDNSFTRAIIKHAELFSNFGKTYFYQFSYDGPTGGISVHYDGADGVGHSEELHYLFCSGEGCDISEYPNDQITQQRLIKLWTNFAKYQNPTPEPSELLQNITWPLVSTEEGDFLYLDINEDLEVRNHPKEATYQKWVDLYDSLDFSDFDTY